MSEQRLCEPQVELVRERHQAQQHHEHARQRAQDPIAELDQVRNEARLRLVRAVVLGRAFLNVLRRHGVAAPAARPAQASSCSVDALAGDGGSVGVGGVGAGQLGKTCNNMMHWAACCANFEVLALAKRYGVNAQHMREILLECPARNTTLDRWDNTRFTWQEKDMDVAMELAQTAKLPLPLFGTIDQLVKMFSADDVSALLYGEKAEYLGVDISAMRAQD